MKKGFTFILLAIALFACVSCSSKPAENTAGTQTETINSSDSSVFSDDSSIVGIWDIVAVMQSGEEVVPMPDGPFLQMKSNGEFSFYLDESINCSGKWERIDSAESEEDVSNELNPYENSSDDENVSKMYYLEADDLNFFLTEMESGAKYLSVIGSDDLIMFILGE